MSFPRPLRRLAAVASVLALSLPAAFAAPSAGWTHLHQNRIAEARAAFGAAVKKNANDIEALRGLGRLAVREGDDAAAVQAWRALYRAAPGHWSASALWPQFVSRARIGGRTAIVEAAARDILASAKAPADLKTSARYALLAAAQETDRTAEVDSQVAAVGLIRKWQAIGPFDNVSLSGFDKAYEPERRLNLGGRYAGANDRQLGWHPLAAVSRVGTCKVDDSLGGESESVYYAVTAVSAPADETAALRFDTNGASKIWINGVPVFRDPVYRDSPHLTADPFTVRVNLRKGWNTVLVKLADDSESGASFSLRFTAPGSDAPRRYPADPTKATLAAPVADPGSVPAAVTSTAALLAGPAATDPEAAALLGEHLRDTNDLEGALRVLREAVGRWPEDAWLRWQLSRTLNEDGQEDEAREERDAARKADRRLVEAETDYLIDEAESATPTEQIGRLKQLLQRHPGYTRIRWMLVRAYREAEMESEAVAAIKAIVRAHPGAAAWSQAVQMVRSEGRAADAQAMLTSALKIYPGSDVLLRQRAMELMLAGKAAEALAAYERLQQKVPAASFYRLQAATLYERRNDLPRAAKALRAARALKPQDADLAARLADVVRRQGQKAEAIALLKEAVRFDPAAVGLREKLQRLSGERPILDTIPATPVEPILAAARTPAGAGVSEVVLLDEARQVVYPDGATAKRVRFIVRVVDAAAVKKYQQVGFAVESSTAHTTVEVARLIRPNGKIVNAADHAGMYGVMLPSLAVGDIIDVSYRVEDYNDGALARHFWTQWFFRNDGPVKLSRYVLVTPAPMTFQQRRHGAAPEPTVKDAGLWKIHEWKMADLAAMKEEVQGTHQADYSDWVDISTIASWKDVVAWYQDLARPRCAPDSAVRAKARELTADVKTDEEKIEAIVAFVSQEIQYQSNPFRMSAYIPTKGKQVLRERYGDCKDKAALLCSLLDTIGIRARMVLLSGRSDGITPYLPSPRFNHAIARVDTATGPLWVDATADRMEFGGIPSEDQGVPALVIDDATADLTTTPALPAERNGYNETYTGTVQESGKATGSFAWTASGDLAWVIRSAFDEVPEGNRDEIVRAIAAEFMKNARFRSPRLENLADVNRPVAFNTDFEKDDFGASAGNFLLIRLPWEGFGIDDQLLSLPENAERSQDLEVSEDRGHFVRTFRLVLPDGYTPQDLQPEVHQETPWGSYRVTFRMEGNTLHGRAETKLSALRVPVKEVPKYFEFLRALNKETQRQLVFKKG